MKGVREGGVTPPPPSPPTFFPAYSQVNDDVNVLSPSRILLHGGGGGWGIRLCKKRQAYKDEGFHCDKGEAFFSSTLINTASSAPSGSTVSEDAIVFSPGLAIHMTYPEKKQTVSPLRFVICWD
jgi:hypothetical protein